MSEQESVGDWDESPDLTPDEGGTPVLAVAETPAPETPAPEPEPEPEQTASESETEEAPETRDPRTGRYRAKKDRAKPGDVGRINELTRKLRTTEETLTSKLRETEAELQRLRAERTQPVPPASIGDEPTIEQFADKDDPYGSWQRALAAYDRKRERFDEQQQQFQRQQEAYQAQQQQVLTQISLSHQQRLAAAAAADPTVPQRLAQVQDYIPPALDHAIMLDSDSATVALFLADHPVVLDELLLMVGAQPYSEGLVGKVQRVLRQRMHTAGSGSVTPSRPFIPAPRPPNPLRTAPMNTGSGQVPADDNWSLEAHEKAFPARRRRR